MAFRWQPYGKRAAFLDSPLCGGFKPRPPFHYLPRPEPAAPSSRKNLLQLPIEIRLRIYEQLFSDDSLLLIGRNSLEEYSPPITLYGPSAPKFPFPLGPDDAYNNLTSALPVFVNIYHSGNLPALLQVCHQIRDEALPCFSKATTVAVLPPRDTSRLSAIRLVPRHYLNHTTCVILGHDCKVSEPTFYGDDFRYSVQDAIDHSWFPNLQDLRIVIGQLHRCDLRPFDTLKSEAKWCLEQMPSIGVFYCKLSAMGRKLLPRLFLHAIYPQRLLQGPAMEVRPYGFVLDLINANSMALRFV
ncbi:uncharacterized protein AB675_12020 [Cyphellophora attinorum]|uniref:F-box domain-containing protein n=1 Tax=Cyphellophora attinorum TaxID=1664694 RepID=A0A0N1H1X7_9EURO|nr:uncharacterized protein AB675_12020 [Phialophora attinorum]KPI38284.1 hypothetical protein AB675_12020 [Phialophora attinorum]